MGVAKWFRSPPTSARLLRWSSDDDGHMNRRHPQPDLNHFVAAYPVSVVTQFRGGSISIVGIFIYQDGLRIEWLLPSRPDLSWMDDVTIESSPYVPEEFRHAEVVDGHLYGKRLRELWSRATLSDGGGREFKMRFWRSEPASGLVGSLGEAICICPPPTGSTELTLHFGGTDVAIPLQASEPQRAHTNSPRLRAGYPGPKLAIPFHGGAIKVISVLVYQDRARMEWLVDPVPDLSWLFHDDLSGYLRPGAAADIDELQQARWSRDFARTYALWMGARLTDNLRTPYQGTLGSSGTSSSGFKGEVNFTPTVPVGARELHLVMHDLSVFIPLGSG